MKLIKLMKTYPGILVAITLLFSACQKDESDSEIQSLTFEINASGSTAWKYFSFEKNDTIEVADPASSVEWDLAFQRYRIRTNGGESGAGMGSAANSYLKGPTGFESLTMVHDTSTFQSDITIQIAVQQGYATYIVNPVLYTWFAMEQASQGTQIVPADFIYIVKTADGKYAKVWFKSYYSASDQSGYITIQYKYQPDGSKRFE